MLFRVCIFPYLCRHVIGPLCGSLDLSKEFVNKERGLSNLSGTGFIWTRGETIKLSKVTSNTAYDLTMLAQNWIFLFVLSNNTTK